MARAPALPRCAAVVDSPSTRCGRAEGEGVADGLGWPTATMAAARSTARPASTVPRPAPGAPAWPVLAPAPVLPASAWVTCAAVRCGYLDQMRAATPATMPLDVLVELIRV